MTAPRLLPGIRLQDLVIMTKLTSRDWTADPAKGEIISSRTGTPIRFHTHDDGYQAVSVRFRGHRVKVLRHRPSTSPEPAGASKTSPPTSTSRSTTSTATSPTAGSKTSGSSPHGKTIVPGPGIYSGSSAPTRSNRCGRGMLRVFRRRKWQMSMAFRGPRSGGS
jgi:hypothetical protein